MTDKKFLNVHEAPEYFENLYVSSEDDLSDDEDFISRGRLVILPPNDEGNNYTNENSGDENELLLNNLNRRPLLADVTVDLITSSGNIPIGTWDEEEAAGPSVDVPSKRNEGLNFNGIL